MNSKSSRNTKYLLTITQSPLLPLPARARISGERLLHIEPVLVVLLAVTAVVV